MDGIHYSEASKGRSLSDLTPNELRARLLAAGVDPYAAKTKEELVELVKTHC